MPSITPRPPNSKMEKREERRKRRVWRSVRGSSRKRGTRGRGR